MAKKSQITVNAAVISHIGNVRTNNEDNFYFDGMLMQPDEVNEGCSIRVSRTADYHLFAICDGMGGLEGGERASYIGVSGMKELYRPGLDTRFQEAVQEYAMKATDLILEDAANTGKGQKEGTTMVMLYMSGRKGYVANIGDSRVYVIRQGRLAQISKDHSVVFQKMLRGELTREQARKHPQANAISHFMGMAREKIHDDYVSYEEFDLVNGDRFLICSDGLSDLLSFERIEHILGSANTPIHVARKLVLDALEMGGKDNTTVIVGDISGNQLQVRAVSELTGMDTESDSATEN